MSHLTPRQHGNTTSNKVPYPEHDTHASTWPPRPSSIVVGAAAAAAPGAEASSVNWIASAAGRVCGELSRRAKLLAEPILRADEKPPLDRPPPSRAWVCAGLVVGRGADATQMESHRFTRDVKVPKGAPGLKFGTSQNACRTAPRSAYFLANSSSVLPILRHVESRCSAMLEYRAYVHHYERYGTTAQDLEAALSSLRAQIGDYDGLAPVPEPPAAAMASLTLPPPPPPR